MHTQFVIGDGTQFTSYKGQYGTFETAALFRTAKSAEKVIRDTRKHGLNSNRQRIANPEKYDIDHLNELKEEIAFWDRCHVYSVQVILGPVVVNPNSL